MSTTLERVLSGPALAPAAPSSFDATDAMAHALAAAAPQHVGSVSAVVGLSIDVAGLTGAVGDRLTIETSVADGRTGDWRLVYVISAKSRSGDATARCAMVIIMGPGKVDAPTSLLEALGLLPSEQRFLGQFL